MTDMAYDPAGRVDEFQKACGVKSFIELDEAGRRALLNLRMKLIREECNEVTDEILDALNGDGDILRLAKELADLKYVIYGTEVLFDIPSYAVYNEVADSNMSKLGPDGIPVRREDGKILKGEHYREADIGSVFSASA